MSTSTLRVYFRLAAIAALAGLALGCSDTDPPSGNATSDTAPSPVIRAPREFSGIAWLRSEVDDGVEQEVFLVVHDTRDNEDERDLPRVSLVRTPVDTDGIVVDELTELEFPTVPNDLESVARVPGRDVALLAESNADGDDPDPTIYVATWDDALEVEIVASAPWPETPDPLFNVEASAVADVAGQTYFLYAERDEGESAATIHMTALSVADDGSLTFGDTWQSLTVAAPPLPDSRPASALDVAGDGRVIVTSASDPGDLGPFDSVTWVAAIVGDDGAGGAALTEVPAAPVELARSAGLKIESVVAVDGAGPVFVGTDDEDYGGILRQIPVAEPAG